MTTLPPFDLEGVLPKGDYPMTLSELRHSHLVRGLNPASTWDADWRERLVDHLEFIVNQLWAGGITEIFIDGSFVENKDHPHDIDGYFECGKRDFLTGNLERRLNSLSPDKLWTWDPALRRFSGSTGKSQLPMWHLHRVDMYPHYGQICGVRDAYGQDMLFPSLFRTMRYRNRQKGIVKLVHRPTGDP